MKLTFHDRTDQNEFKIAWFSAKLNALPYQNNLSTPDKYSACYTINLQFLLQKKK